MNRRVAGLVLLLGLAGCATPNNVIPNSFGNPPANVSVSPEYATLTRFKDSKGCSLFRSNDLTLFQEMRIPVSFIEEKMKEVDANGNPVYVITHRTRDITGKLTESTFTYEDGCRAWDVSPLVDAYRNRPSE